VELISAMRSSQKDFVDAIIRRFSATGNALLRTCTDFDTKRQFLKDHIERVIFNGYRIAILGSVPVPSIAGETTLQFRIEGEISKMQVRANATRMTIEKQGRLPRPAPADTLSASPTLKGAGPTPYSRRGDARAALGPSCVNTLSAKLWRRLRFRQLGRLPL
jgi:hypothetical protein